MSICRAASIDDSLASSVRVEWQSETPSTPRSLFCVATLTVATVAARWGSGSDWASEPPPEVWAGAPRGIHNPRGGCFHVTHNALYEVVVADSTGVHAIIRHHSL
jgi:hypothetical protein